MNKLETRPFHRASAERERLWAHEIKRSAPLIFLLVALCEPALAAVTLVADPALSDQNGQSQNITHTRRLTMRVGAATFGTVNNVTFGVTGANIGPSPAPVIGVPDANAAPASATANSVRVSVSNRWTDFAGQRVVVTANSSAGLACASGTCGTTVIPFNKVSWTSSGLETGTYAGQDFLSGSFSGSPSQTLLDFTAPAARSFSIVNDWVFSYSNDTLYPAGVYTGRVTFTATMP